MLLAAGMKLHNASFEQGRIAALPPTSKWHFSLVAAWVVKQAGSSKLLAKLNAPMPAEQMQAPSSMVF